MNRPAPHVIATQSIQIAMDQETGAREIMELAVTLGERKLAVETEEIFSAFCPPGRRVQLERIELALGSIPEAEFEFEFPVRFRAALRTELERRLGLPAADPADKPASSAAGSPLDLLEHLLLHGTLPWWGPHETDFDPVAALTEELRQTPVPTGALVRRIGRHQRVRFRLIHWLADPQIAALVHAVAPADAGFIVRYARDLDARQREERFVPANSEEFRAAKWEIILAHLLTDHGSNFNAKSFLRQTLQGFAAHFRVGYTELLGQLARVAREARVAWGESSLPQLLQEIHAEDVLGAAPVPPESTAEFLAAWADELNHPVGPATESRRTALAFWNRLPPAVVRDLVAQLVHRHGRSAVAARLAAVFSTEERTVLHALLTEGRGRAEPAEGGPSDLWRNPGQLTGVGAGPEPAADDLAVDAPGDDEAKSLHTLRILLETGRLPDEPGTRRWTDRAGAWLLVTLAKLGDSAPPLLRTWARTGGLTAAMSEHLDREALESVVEAVEPAQAEVVKEFVRTAGTVSRKTFPPVPGTPAFRQGIWQIVLDYLLVDRGSAFNRRSFLKHSIRGLAARYGLDVETVVEFLAVAAQSAGRHQLGRELGALAEKVDRAAPPAVPPEPAREPEGDSGFSEALLRHSPLARLRLLALLLHEAGTPHGVPAPALLPTLWGMLETMAGGQPDAWHELLRRGGTSPAIDVMLATQGERVLELAIFAGEPAQVEIWRESVAWLEHSAAAATLFPGGRAGLRGRLWHALVALWREAGGRPVRDLAAWLVLLLLRSGATRAAGATAVHEATLRATLEAALDQDGSHAGRRLAAGVKRAAGTPPPPAPPAALPQPPPHIRDAGPAEPIAVTNAGLVLLAPFFPELHRRCGLLDGKLFRDFPANQRAVHLLQYLVTAGARTHEYSLVLNKILCGLDPAVPVVPEIELTELEKAAAQQLLENVAKQWPRGAVISADGIRGSYLWRPGLLKRRDHGWALQVERRGWDVLLPELPWSFPGVPPAWMPEPLYVNWI